MANFVSKNAQQKSGGNHSAIIVRSAGASSGNGEIRLGVACWDPARAQFCFTPDQHDLALTAAEQAEIVAILNSLTR